MSGAEEPMPWCYLYELPFPAHLAMCLRLSGTGGLLRSFAEGENAIQQEAAIVDTADGSIAKALSELDQEGVEGLKDALPALLGVTYSLARSVQCILLFGCYLNELVARVREHQDDKALFNVLRIDPTAIGCVSILRRMSRATLTNDRKFAARLRAALSGKMKKREQANYQKMRLILLVLSEAGAGRLSDERLETLFVQELRLYTSSSKHGDVRRNLRKFANEYMRRDAST